MSFKIEYEDLKKILSVFYNSPYKNVAYFVDILHSLKEEETELTLKQKINIELALLDESTPKEG